MTRRRPRNHEAGERREDGSVILADQMVLDELRRLAGLGYGELAKPKAQFIHALVRAERDYGPPGIQTIIDRLSRRERLGPRPARRRPKTFPEKLEEDTLPLTVLSELELILGVWNRRLPRHMKHEDDVDKYLERRRFPYQAPAEVSEHIWQLRTWHPQFWPHLRREVARQLSGHRADVQQARRWKLKERAIFVYLELEDRLRAGKRPMPPERRAGKRTPKKAAGGRTRLALAREAALAAVRSLNVADEKVKEDLVRAVTGNLGARARVRRLLRVIPMLAKENTKPALDRLRKAVKWLTEIQAETEPDR